MTMSIKNYTKHAFIFVAIVFVSQHLFIAFVPNLIFVIAKQRSGKPLNTVIHAPKTDAKLRKVVLPNPDFIYSAVFYDLSENDLHISGLFPDSSQYTSIAFYGSNAQPFHVINNLDGRRKNLNMRLSMEFEDEDIVKSPTKQGVVLMRYLIKSPKEFERTKRLQMMFKIQEV
jgi:uncharacterized membrane protein